MLYLNYKGRVGVRHSEQCFTPRRCFEVPPIGSMEIDEGAVARTGPVDALRTSLKLAGTFLYV